MPECLTTVSHKRPLDYDLPLGRKALEARAACSALDWLLSMDKAHARIFGFDGAQCLASDAMGGDWCDDKITPYPDDDHGHDWDFADVSVDSHVDICASSRRAFDAIREQCRSANVAVPESAGGVFSLALQNLNDFTGHDFVVGAKVDVLESLCVVDETAVASRAGRTFEKTDMVCEPDEACKRVESLNIDLVVRG